MELGQEGICAGCGYETEVVQCVEKIVDFQYGRPAVQKHYYLGSRCCGEEVTPMEDEEDITKLKELEG